MIRRPSFSSANQTRILFAATFAIAISLSSMASSDEASYLERMPSSQTLAYASSSVAVPSTAASGTISRLAPDRFPLSVPPIEETPRLSDLIQKRIAVAVSLAIGLFVVLTVATQKTRWTKAAIEPSSMTLVSTVRVAPRRFVSLLRVEGKSVLVSQDATGIKQMAILSPSFDAMIDADDSTQIPSDQV